MFTQRTEPFGPLEQVTFSNEAFGHIISFLPAYGACITRLIINGVDILDGLESYEMLQHNHRFRSSWLFPWANRIKDGRYSFQAKNYQLPINEVKRHNALHGFAYEQVFGLENVGLSEKVATAHLNWSYDGRFSGYPFPFSISIYYEFSVEEGLKTTYEVSNRGEHDMPWVAGWHPYFRFEGQADNWHLQLPAIKHWHQVDEQMIPTGQTETFARFEKLSRIGETMLDHCLEVSIGEAEAKAILVNETQEHTLQMWQETGFTKYNFLQVYIPPDRKSIALEPMSANVNAFNNGDGLVVLQPGESKSASFGLVVLPK